jgi:hypothetical protein
LVIAVIASVGAYIVLSQPSTPIQDITYYNTPKPSAIIQGGNIPTAKPSSNSQTQAPTQNTAATIKYKTVSFTDTQGIGTKAFSMLIPTGWQSSGEVTWILDNPAMPAFGTFKAWNPNGVEEFNYFPNQAFFSSNNPLLEQTFPVGTHYFGAEVRPLLSPTDALKQIIVPAYRSNVQNLQIISEQQLPELSNVIQTGTDPASGVSSSANGGKIRIQYTQNSVAMEEEMYCVIQTLDIPVQTMYGTATNINWYMTYLQSFKAAQGQLDAQTKMFQTISHSAHVDKVWLNKYNQVVNYLIQQQIKQIQSIGQLSNIISQTSNEISDANYQAW